MRSTDTIITSIFLSIITIIMITVTITIIAIIVTGIITLILPLLFKPRLIGEMANSRLGEDGRGELGAS